MDRIGIRELRQHASVYIERVKKGEALEVTERGEVVALLSPAPKPSLYDRLVAEGKVIPGQGKLQEWLRANPPVADAESRMSVSDALQEQREDRF